MLKSQGWTWGVLAGLLAIAWGLSFLIETPKAQSGLSRYTELLEGLDANAPKAEIVAAVNVQVGVRLQPEDLSVWETLKAQGHPAEEALYIVISYRQAKGKLR